MALPPIIMITITVQNNVGWNCNVVQFIFSFIFLFILLLISVSWTVISDVSSGHLGRT